jgi:serine/threonine protein kinase
MYIYINIYIWIYIYRYSSLHTYSYAYISIHLYICMYKYTYLCIYRDLKLENFLFEEKNTTSPLVLIDFGLSKFYDKEDKMNHRYIYLCA